MQMTMFSLLNILLQVGMIFTLYTTAFGGRSELCHLLSKSCPIIRKFQDTKSPLEQINFISRDITEQNFYNCL